MSRLSPAVVLRHALRFLVPVSIALTIYLYLFPVFQTCGFPLPGKDGRPGSGYEAFLDTARLHSPLTADTVTDDRTTDVHNPQKRAPFRLLTLADPQLEGDTSIPNAHSESFPHLSKIASHITFKSEHSSFRERVRQTLHDLVDFYLEDIPNTLESIRKRIDLFGNDFYLAHIYRTLHWWTIPTHVTVLGDLVGSQWLDDEEFDSRAQRYWSRVFRDGERVPDDVAGHPGDEYDLAGLLGTAASNETEAWTRRLINVAGNHDIGYAGDINHERLGRFERAFGKANYELRFELALDPSSPAAATVFDEASNEDSDRLPPELRIVVLNDMNLDTPASTPELQDATYAFVNDVINTASAVEYKGHFTLVLTHVPLYKPEGVCADSPLFEFHDDGTVKEQNQLSYDATAGFLQGVYGLSGDTNTPANGNGRRGLILNGHDHVGCDTWHFINQSQGQDPSERKWEVRRLKDARAEQIPGGAGLPGLREITVRSMMGDFGGNAGLLSIWFDEATWDWRYEFVTCPLGTQHLWWLVHIVDLITVVAIVLYGVVGILAAVGVDLDALIASQLQRKQPKKPSPKQLQKKNIDAGAKKNDDAATAPNGDVKAKT